GPRRRPPRGAPLGARPARPGGHSAGLDAELQRRLDAAADQLSRRVARHFPPSQAGRDLGAGRRPLSDPPPRARRPNLSAGLLLYRRGAAGLEVFLAHPGGPFWRARDAGAWTIPAGAEDPGEELRAPAGRER